MANVSSGNNFISDIQVAQFKYISPEQGVKTTLTAKISGHDVTIQLSSKLPLGIDDILKILTESKVGSTSSSCDGLVTQLKNKNVTQLTISYSDVALKNQLASIKDRPLSQVTKTAEKTRSQVAFKILSNVAHFVTQNPFELPKSKTAPQESAVKQGVPSRPSSQGGVEQARQKANYDLRPLSEQMAGKKMADLKGKSHDTGAVLRANMEPIERPGISSRKSELNPILHVKQEEMYAVPHQLEEEVNAVLQNELGATDAKALLPFFLKNCSQASCVLPLLNQLHTTCAEGKTSLADLVKCIKENSKNPADACRIVNNFIVGVQGLSKAPSEPLPFSERLNVAERFRPAQGKTENVFEHAYESSSKAQKAISQAVETFDAAFKIAFTSVKSSELHDGNWSKNDKHNLSPNVVALTQLVNATATFFATKIVEAGMVAGELPEPVIDANTSLAVRPPISEKKEAKAQAASLKMLEVTIETAYKLMQIGNYSAALAIVSAVGQNSIDRLKLKERLPDSCQTKLAELESTFDIAKNSKNLRACYADCQAKNKPFVPSLTTFQTELTMIHDSLGAVPNRAEGIMRYGDVLSSIQETQNKLGKVPSAPQTTLAFQAIEAISGGLDELLDRNYQRSRMIYLKKA